MQSSRNPAKSRPLSANVKRLMRLARASPQNSKVIKFARAFTARDLAYCHKQGTLFMEASSMGFSMSDFAPLFMTSQLAGVFDVSFAAANGIDAETAEDFWFSCDGTGWKYKGNAIINWRSMLQSWNRARKRKAAQAASELARMEKRVDEREARRERRAGGGRRKADNNVEMSDEVREEVRRDFTF